MTKKKSNKTSYPTDKSTDYLFAYFINEDKFNHQMEQEWKEELDKRLENCDTPKLDSRIITEKNNDKNSELHQTELPSNSDDSSDSKKSNDEFLFDEEESTEDKNSESSVKSSSKT